jgi:hypothetical protein
VRLWLNKKIYGFDFKSQRLICLLEKLIWLAVKTKKMVVVLSAVVRVSLWLNKKIYGFEFVSVVKGTNRRWICQKCSLTPCFPSFYPCKSRNESPCIANMIERHLASYLSDSLKNSPAVVLLGPRQVGKTTLALAVAQEYNSIYLDLESEQDRAKLSQPELYLADHCDPLVFFDKAWRLTLRQYHCRN